MLFTLGTRATHMGLLRRQTASGQDSSLVIHWHDRDSVHVWLYDFADVDTLKPQSQRLPRTYLLSTPDHNIFCSAHCTLHDGRLLIVGGTVDNSGAEIGTVKTSAFDASQANLWTATNQRSPA